MVDTHISDLFFNRNLDDCRILDRGQFQGWDDMKLAEEADYMLDSLDGLGVEDLPDVNKVVEDFLARC